MNRQRRTTRPALLAWQACCAALLLLVLTGTQVLGQAEDEATGPAEPATPAEGQANTDPAIEPQPEPEPKPTLTVRDLVVLQTDRYGEIANDKTVISSSLFVPIKHSGRSKIDGGPDVQGRTTMPVGLISFEGKIEKSIRVRLDLVSEKGYFHAHWPEDAEKGARQIDWKMLAEATEKQRVDTRTPKEHWLNGLRDSEDRLWIKTRHPYVKERFLLYDASMPFKATLKLNQTDSGMVLVSEGDAAGPPLAIVLKEDKEGWTSTKSAGPWANEAGVTIDLKADTALKTPTAKAALKPLAQLLEQRGYNAQEIDTALNIVDGARIERSTMSLIYVLPEEEIKNHIWLRFKPEPDRVVRTAIVVLNNVDPDLGSRLDQLVAGLGDKRWAVRYKSQRELESIGLAAIRRVQAARDHEDPEIEFRVRQILDAYDMRTKDLE